MPKSDKWECDGCGRVVSEKKTVQLCGCKDHQGYMQVGGPAWNDYHDKGIHPMTGITEQVRKIYNKRMEN